VISTLSSTVDAFGGDSATDDPWSINHQPQDSKTRAYVPRDIATQHSMRPFVPPPVPQVPSQDKIRATRGKRSSTKERKWTTTITLTESISTSGQKTYYASGTPLERMPMKQPHIPTVVIQEPTRLTYIQRRRARRMSIRDPLSRKETMLAISVKRQRKLKMKKKKYKKLMKRTRSLRKKLGKI
jgi:hypothetical protein